jgi:hypothetical protein
MCRVEYEKIVRDLKLHQELYHNGPTIPCRFEGCPERSLLLPVISQHEKVCEYVPVRCRYALYGCDWTGKRGMVKAHEEDGCSYAPMAGLIEEFRKFKAESVGRLDMVQHQALGAARVTSVVQQTVAREQMFSITDVFQVLHYCHCLTVSAPHCIFTRVKWGSFWRAPEKRAAVINLLVFLPFVLSSVCTLSHGVASFCTFLDRLLWTATKLAKESNSKSFPDISTVIAAFWDSKVERMLDDSFLGFCAGMLGFMTVLINFIDEKSSKSWRGVKFRHLGTPPIVGDLIAISSFTLLLTILEYNAGGVKATTLWFLVTFTSTFFPSLVSTLSNYMAVWPTNNFSSPETNTSNMASIARSIEPLMFGLRYSLLACNFGMPACLDAAIVVHLLPEKILKRHFKDCFIGQLPPLVCFAFLAAKSAVWFADLGPFSGDSSITPVLGEVTDSFLAAGSLVFINTVVYGCFAMGNAVGNSIAKTSSTQVRADHVLKDYNVTGLVSFSAWAVALVMLVQL